MHKSSVSQTVPPALPNVGSGGLIFSASMCREFGSLWARPWLYGVRPAGLTFFELVYPGHEQVKAFGPEERNLHRDEIECLFRGILLKYI